MADRSVLIKEIDSLHPRYYSEVIDFVGFIKEKKKKSPFPGKSRRDGCRRIPQR